jgi:hypothetical protein
LIDSFSTSLNPFIVPLSVYSTHKPEAERCRIHSRSFNLFSIRAKQPRLGEMGLAVELRDHNAQKGSESAIFFGLCNLPMVGTFVGWFFPESAAIDNFSDR